jgi:glycine hydroxymethyltransferase
MEAQGSMMTNKYAEGYPGPALLWRLPVRRHRREPGHRTGKKLFGCGFANVQPNSGSQANQGVFTALLQPGDTILGMSLDAGGHLTHGARPTSRASGSTRSSTAYARQDNLLDYDQVEALAKEHKPKLIIAGGSAVPRQIDFARFARSPTWWAPMAAVDMAHFAGAGRGGRTPRPSRTPTWPPPPRTRRCAARAAA